MIKIDMEFPKSCHDCDCCRTICLNGSDREYMCGIYGHDIVRYYLEETTNKRPKFCPLIEVKDNNWISIKEHGYPKKDGEYLVTVEYKFNNNSRHIKESSFATDLFKVDEYDFAIENKGKCGFYDYDSEYGFFINDNIIAWCELPKVYEGE